MDTKKLFTELSSLRKDLHQHPELSGYESSTADRIISFAQKYNPDEIIEKLGGHGIAIIFNGKESGNTVLIRCELDALPIQEINDFKYRSDKRNISHKCGHDGHMAIVSGLITVLSENRIEKGRVILLYQPAEETGTGAELVLEDSRFKKLQPDFVFALHNLPGFELNQIIYKRKEFAAASKGLIIRLTGKTSHAAEPEKGISPAAAVAELIRNLTVLPSDKVKEGFALVTIIHSIIGERAFGTTPGYAELMATLRSFQNDDMNKLTSGAKELIEKTAADYNLKFEIEWVEEFPATINDNECIDVLIEISEELKLSAKKVDQPFKWSEDFGHFTNNFKGALFGIGSGVNHPQLHNPDYDFPDDIIITGVNVFYSLIKKFL